ncbi:GntR family transcriptional regulator [Mobiluncus mulieris]|uniref:GntR family transcriptional regulator n=1 Tax=Mobiluncus mulieris TaxID=2052 RepID=A0A2J9KQ64_9ACTO|nr:GntR family transcriptional regulator [Mobiluncus mulieris]EEZ90908.1 transcriptional regulator, GntR family [Mobiluncus mulieris 28-1]EFN93779.1 transcriptional regulator, GntR family [Mobiluncus mulieris FB024-16]MBB5845731.1 GntR family transcriptional regulator [Mobiluncus mulieris]MCU9969860.1 GntR family transcriptional regulator [Mobiluncus mulieris]MCU9971106.1 GntR family transcriptional regulator [Mobiluncus mulieris]
MDIQIRNSSDDPIYLQIKNQLKRAIVTGELAAGEQLPSIRLLAKELRVSVITTKRAYDELEKEGFTNSVVGKGSFVAAQNSELLREEYLRKLEAVLRDALKYAALAQLSRAELLEMIDLLDEEPGGNE